MSILSNPLVAIWDVRPISNWSPTCTEKVGDTFFGRPYSTVSIFLVFLPTLQALSTGADQISTVVVDLLVTQFPCFSCIPRHGSISSRIASSAATVTAAAMGAASPAPDREVPSDP